MTALLKVVEGGLAQQDELYDVAPKDIVSEWGDKALQAAFDIVRYGIDPRPGMEHMDGPVLERAIASVPRDCLSGLKDADDMSVKVAASIISLWHDVVRYKAEIELAEAAGGRGLKSVEAVSILEGRMRAEAGAFVNNCACRRR